KGPALSIAQASGPFVIGLSLSPPQPGRVRAQVTVVGVQPGDGLRDVHLVAQPEASVKSSRDAVDLVMQPCGFGCFAADGVLASSGRWVLSVTMSSNRGHVSTTDVVPLPAPAATTELARAINAMEH